MTGRRDVRNAGLQLRAAEALARDTEDADRVICWIGRGLWLLLAAALAALWGGIAYWISCGG